MKSYRQEQLQDAGSHTPYLSRRAFVTGAASACAAAFLWSRPRSSFASDRGNTVTIIEFAPNGKKIGKVTVARIVKSDAEWEQQLSPLSYEITRHNATEQAYTGNTWNLHDRGLYRCICCDTALFNSNTKFESGTGWPSFWEPIASENIAESTDRSDGMRRTAISCRRCGAHLGHVFNDGPPPTGLRYCMNSAAMRFVKLA